jgi:hypothetical protein
MTDPPHDSDSPIRTAWQRLQHGWPPSYPIAQFPNVPLLAAIGGLGVAAVSDGAVHDYARATFFTGLTAWAWWEVTDGVNTWRRVVGAAGLAFVVVSVGQALQGG